MSLLQTLTRTLRIRNPTQSGLRNLIHDNLVFMVIRYIIKRLCAISLFVVIVNMVFAQTPVVYTFTGNGKWSDSVNWLNKLVPISGVPAGSTIIINGSCVFDLPQLNLNKANIIVNSGGNLTLPSGLVNKDSSTTPPVRIFEKYTIAKGAHYSDKNNYVLVSQQELAFIVKFDSSAIYHTVSSSNQVDINKLYGFSDNNEQHQKFSARFGWRWRYDSLQIFGYVYNNGILNLTRLGTVEIGSENSCSIKVNKDTYLFTLNGKETIMPRASGTAAARGYKLYPYFGGDEVAPHEISIWIAELNAP